LLFEVERNSLQIRYTLTPKEFAEGNTSLLLNSTWSAFEKSLETERLFVLLFNPVQFLPIPKRAMAPEQIEELHSLLNAHISKA
jgi:hypothetical protein